ncbi:MAG: diguanylate cyclase [Magnetococcales bacterium]|nr:diguanylate cyclase [Magnetococcales bacterium]
MWGKKSLIYPILGLLALTALASVVSGFFINYYPVHANIHSELDQEVAVLHKTVGSLLEEETLGLPRLGHVLQGDRALRNLLKNERNSMLAMHLGRVFGGLGVDMLIAINPAGKVLYRSSGDEQTVFEVSDEFQSGVSKVQEGEAVLLAIQAKGSLAVMAFSPVFQDGSVVGAVIVGTQFGDRLANYLSRGVAFPVAFAISEKILGSAVPLDEWIATQWTLVRQSIADQEIFYEEKHADSQAIFYTPVRVLSHELTVMVFVDLIQSHGPLFQSGKRLMWSALIIMIFVSILGFATYLFLIFPLRRLYRKSQVLMEVCKADGIPVTLDDLRKGNEIHVLDQALETASLIVYTHIGRLHQQKETFENMAVRDSLTGLGNRRSFEEFLDRSLEWCGSRKSSLAVFYLDLDHFKPVNDKMGHDVGDLLLKAVSERFLHCARESDGVFRLGGDEFAAILPDCDRNFAKSVAERYNQEIARPYTLKGNNCNIGVSIGISLFPEHGDERDILLKHADMALYASKGKGRGTFSIFSEEAC